MNDMIRAELPADIADELTDEGFEGFVPRGAFIDGATLLSVATTGLAAGANVTTILLAREDIARFVTAIRRWAGRKAPDRVGTEVTVDISARRGDNMKRLQLRIESEDGLSETDTRALTAFVTSLIGSGVSDTEAGHATA